MFAGIVEGPVTVRTVADAAGLRRLVLDLAPLRAGHRTQDPDAGPAPREDEGEGPAGWGSGRGGDGSAGPRDGRPAGSLVRLGDSVAVNGVCLTVAGIGEVVGRGDAGGDLAAFDVVAETLSRTNLGALGPGARVNVERSLRYGDPVDGHLVSGHVDCTGRVVSLAATGGDVRLTVACGPEFVGRLLPKGAVAVDGVSLTIAELGADRFTLALVPHTLRWTTLGDRVEGDRVNLEPDLLGQWVLRAVERLGPAAAS